MLKVFCARKVFQSLLLISIIFQLVGCAISPKQVCSNAVQIPETILSAKVVLLGEQHGTSEMPKFVTDSVCQFLAKGLSVDVGLELPIDEQARFDQYLRSGGKYEDIKALLNSSFWQRKSEEQDGRTSIAMLALIEWVRDVRTRGSNISLFAFDKSLAINTDKLPRDEAMAANISERISRSTSDVTIVFAGNYHAMKVPLEGTSIKPMGSFLRYPQTVAFLLGHDGGTAWQCSSSRCGVVEAGKCETPMPKKQKISLIGQEFPSWAKHLKVGYDGYFDISCVTASLPANAAQSQR